MDDAACVWANLEAKVEVMVTSVLTGPMLLDVHWTSSVRTAEEWVSLPEFSAFIEMMTVVACEV